MTTNLRIVSALVVVLLLWLAWDSFYVVSETQQALLVRQGLPIGAVSEPGLRFKFPLLDSAIFFEKRVLTLDPATEQIILGDQKRIEVDTYTAYRISDPLNIINRCGRLTKVDCSLRRSSIRSCGASWGK